MCNTEMSIRKTQKRTDPVEETRYVPTEEVPALLECPVCMDPFTDPVDLPCGHVLCSACSSRCEFRCPVCRAAFMLSTIKKSNFVMRALVGRLATRCTRCSEIVSRQNHADHDNTCADGDKACRYAEFGCGAVLRKSLLADHEKQCPCWTADYLATLVRTERARADQLKTESMKMLTATTGRVALRWCTACSAACISFRCPSHEWDTPGKFCKIKDCPYAEKKICNCDAATDSFWVVFRYADLRNMAEAIQTAGPQKYVVSICCGCSSATITQLSALANAFFIIDHNVSKGWDKARARYAVVHTQTPCANKCYMKTLLFDARVFAHATFADDDTGAVRQTIFFNKNG